MPSFIENVSAAVDYFGVEPVGIVFGIGQTNWDSSEQRDAFLYAITRNTAE
jgi:hypothetical protein